MKTSLAERARARRLEEDRRKRDAGELLRLRARVKVLEALCGEAAGWVVDEKTRDQLMAAGRGEAIREPYSGKTPDNGCGCFLKACPRCWPKGRAIAGQAKAQTEGE